MIFRHHMLYFVCLVLPPKLFPYDIPYVALFLCMDFPYGIPLPQYTVLYYSLSLIFRLWILNNACGRLLNIRPTDPGQYQSIKISITKLVNTSEFTGRFTSGPDVLKKLTHNILLFVSRNPACCYPTPCSPGKNQTLMAGCNT